MGQRLLRALARLQVAGAALPLTALRAGHLLALVRPHRLGEPRPPRPLGASAPWRRLRDADRDLRLRARPRVCRGPAGRLPRASVARRPVAVVALTGERAAGTASGRDTLGTQLEQDLLALLESRQRLDQIERHELVLPPAGPAFAPAVVLSGLRAGAEPGRTPPA